MSKQLNWNVIDDKTFKQRTLNVFEQVANTLKNTLGPYGANTILEQWGQHHITKDGWQVLKKIAFNDTVEQNILQLLTNISAQVVIKVGDGSTSSIVSANSILKQLQSSTELKKIRSKELLNVLNKVVGNITAEIQKSSTKIDPEVDPELTDIYRLAMISTNGDEEVSKIIQTIYKETLNPSIEYNKSKSAQTSYEIIEGYKANITYLDAIFANNEEGICNVNKPYLLMFDHKVEEEYHLNHIIIPAINKAMGESRRLVVMAPHYDKYLLDRIRVQVNAEAKAGNIQTVYARVSLANNNFQEQFNDFAIMTGGTIVREANIREFLPVTPKEGEEAPELSDVTDFLGEVERISIGAETASIQGFYNRNEHMYQIALNDARAKYKKVEEQHHELNIVDSQLYELGKRISKLRGKMGVIHVGGHSSLEKQSSFDLVEDAVKACESAFNYGYNIGGNLIIPITIKKIADLNDQSKGIENTIYYLLYKAFVDVFVEVLSNKFDDTRREELNVIAVKAIETEQCYNLITDEYSSDVINPCHTDIEILRAAISIVSLILSSNQYISINIENEAK